MSTTEARGGWLFGTDATVTGRALVAVACVVGLALFTAQAWDTGWVWWQWLLGAAMIVDLVGGVPANGLDSTRRFYHSPLPGSPGVLRRVVHHPVGFAAIHLQPVLIGALFPGGAEWWGPLWWAVTVASVLAVYRVRPPHRLPLALSIAVLAILAAPLLGGAPTGMAWVVPVLVLKLVVAHTGSGAPDPVSR